jgi:ABC-type amino acid transport substrate-binding protein
VSPAEWQGTPPVPRPVQEQAAVATAGAEKSNPPVSTDDGFVAVLMVRLNIASVSDLTGKSIAIDDTYSASSGTIRTAIVAAGATAVQLSEQSTFAIDRLTNGEVPAAVVALMSAEAAAGFPDIAGFRIFRVPLSPRPLQERR